MSLLALLQEVFPFILLFIFCAIFVYIGWKRAEKEIEKEIANTKERKKRE